MRRWDVSIMTVKGLLRLTSQMNSRNDGCSGDIPVSLLCVPLSRELKYGNVVSSRIVGVL